MRLLSSRFSKRLISTIILTVLVGISSFINPVAAEQGQFFSEEEVICQDVVGLGFSCQVYPMGNTIRIEYKSLIGLPDDNSPRPSVLVDDSIILHRTFRVEMTYLKDKKSRESSRDYYQKTDLLDLFTMESQDNLVENATTDNRKSVIISRASANQETYRFRRDIVGGDHLAVVKIQSPGLDSRCINMPVKGFLDLLERHALTVMASKGLAEPEVVSGSESDNIDLATEDLNLAVEFVIKRKAEGDSDVEIAKLVNWIVSARVQVINNPFPDRWNDWSNLGAFLLNYFVGHYEDSFGKWRNIACFNYDTNAIWAWNNKIGQCEDTAQLSYYLLKNAGVNCNMYATDGHAFVIINTNQARIQESRNWGVNVAVVDPWQNKVLTGQEAFENKYVFNRGRKAAVNTTHLYERPKGYEDIKSRNIVWAPEAKTWRPREGYKFKYLSGAWMGYCIPLK